MSIFSIKKRQKVSIMEMAKYILSILQAQLPIVWSWGFHNVIATETGLSFHVMGFLYQGSVAISCDKGVDLFSVTLLDTGQIEKDVYADSLVTVIDNLVERCDNYSERVKSEYHL